jgi:hypothetical protein
MTGGDLATELRPAERDTQQKYIPKQQLVHIHYCTTQQKDNTKLTTGGLTTGNLARVQGSLAVSVASTRIS